MDIKDLILTPIYLLVLFFFLNNYKNKIEDSRLKRYFLPAVYFKVLGALGLGLVYQFYYGGGDTYNFFRDSQIIWNTFLENPWTAVRIVFAPAAVYEGDLYAYTRYIYYFQDPQTYNVIRVSGFLGFFTFHTYSLIAVGFAMISFSGMWALYKVFYHLYPRLHRQAAISVFFVPSVFFWGSGLMKDSLTLGALGWLLYGVYFAVFERKSILLNSLIIIICVLIIQAIKIYILQVFIPTVLLWIFLSFRNQIRSRALRWILLPILLLGALPLGFWAIQRISAENKLYNLQELSQTTKTTAEWLRYVAQSQGGSAYDLGEFDGTVQNTLSKFPQATWLGLFRPYLFEARNPLMLLSALETTFFLYLFFYIITRRRIYTIGDVFLKEPFLVFALGFSVLFAFAVAVASSNFGTLVRYKIPFIPFFIFMLYVLKYRLTGKRGLY
ncbi:MAG: hypothetical protein EAZ55_07470 [Cytophagales bacterium]|nr:MAG: hypothetical protein EAZ55_07470 [Cytophagales bacterium]